MKLLPRDIWYKNCPDDKGASDCPFCRNIEQENKQLDIWKGKYWYICHNKYPILGMSDIIMAIPYRHVILTSELTAEEYAEFRDVEKFVKDFYGEKEYFMFIRESRKSRSLEHLHYHFVPGRIYYDDIEEMLLKQGFTNQLDS